MINRQNSHDKAQAPLADGIVAQNPSAHYFTPRIAAAVPMRLASPDTLTEMFGYFGADRA